MNIIDIISKKRDGYKLNEKEINFFIQNYTNGNIKDYQAAALIMAIYINGLDEEETTLFAIEMAKSGEILDLSNIGDIIVDKHSTGGVGDKITIVLMPIIASLGIPVMKMSGRGLGFTGGTADKLESIPGYNTEISLEECINNVRKHGISLITMTGNIAPADKKIYALRDVIGCVGSLPLMASSIMSKKIAAGANKIVLEVTVGSGAYMKTKEEAEKLAVIMNKIGKISNKETVCVLTNMDEPTGVSIGNTLEIKEAIECLKGNIPGDIKEIIMELGAYVIKLSGKGDDLENNKKLILENIYNGKALNKFIELVKAQGGDVDYINGEKQFEQAKYVIPVVSDEAGYVKSLNGENIGNISVKLGAGRLQKEDKIDNEVGIVLNKKIADKVEFQDILAYIHSNNEELGKECASELKKAYEFSKEKVLKKPSILGVIR